MTVEQMMAHWRRWADICTMLQEAQKDCNNAAKMEYVAVCVQQHAEALRRK